MGIDKYLSSKFIFMIGIGGSDLASRAIWSACASHNSDIGLPAQPGKKMFFLESPDSREYGEIERFVQDEVANLEDIVMIAVSKSGQTTETLETFHKVFDILSEKFGTPITERIIAVTSKDTALFRLAQSKGIETLEWEGDVSGRFSAFTTPHLTALSLAGLNTARFVEGGKAMAQESEEPGSKAKALAQDIFEQYQKGASILDFFIFNSELEDLGKWCRQLIAESLATLTPTVSLGPVDLHSMLELYLDGPKNRFTIFIESVREIEGSVNESAYRDVTAAYEKAELPFAKYEMTRIEEYELGQFMAFMMEVTLELAALLGVDPYDQPAVEAYKKSLNNK